MTDAYHIPVLAKECIEGMNLSKDSIVVDGTFGGGGHSRLILDALGESGKLFAFDQDVDAVENLVDDRRLVFIRHNFRYVKNFLKYYGVEKVDVMFADFGVSSHEFDEASRGFSFRFEGDLDMRMNRDARLDAKGIVNEYPEDRLRNIFRWYGEVKNAGKLAAQICKARSLKSIKTTSDLKEIASGCAPRATENKYLAQVFQALRIEVNDEMDALKEFVSVSNELLNPGGRLVVLTYHSLEDRLCKNFMRSGNFEGKVEKDFYGNVLAPFHAINRKVIVAGDAELKANPRARSAKLRIAEKV